MGGGGGGGKGGGTPSVPQAPAPEPIPVRAQETEAESKQVRGSEQQRIKKLRGASGTILTSPLGTVGSVQTSGNILGRV